MKKGEDKESISIRIRIVATHCSRRVPKSAYQPFHPLLKQRSNSRTSSTLFCLHWPVTHLYNRLIRLRNTSNGVILWFGSYQLLLESMIVVIWSWKVLEERSSKSFRISVEDIWGILQLRMELFTIFWIAPNLNRAVHAWKEKNRCLRAKNSIAEIEKFRTFFPSSFFFLFILTISHYFRTTQLTTVLKYNHLQ